MAIPPDLWREAEPLLERIEIKAGEHLFRVGEKARKFGLIERGFLRIYYIPSEGVERTKVFRGQGEFIAPYAELLADIPVRTNVQAVRDSVVRLGSYEEFTRKAAGDIRWALFLKHVAERNFLEKDQREYELLTLSATELYEQLLAKNDWVENAPLKMIASYLGITPIALSRIRKRVSS